MGALVIILGELGSRHKLLQILGALPKAAKKIKDLGRSEHFFYGLGETQTSSPCGSLINVKMSNN